MSPHLRALALGNEYRVKRAAAKRRVKAQPSHLAELLADVPKWAEGMMVGDLMRAVPGLGPKGLARLLDEHWISPHRRLGELTERQRRVLGGTP